MELQRRLSWPRAVLLFILIFALLSFAWWPGQNALNESLKSSNTSAASWCKIPQPAKAPEDGLTSSLSLFSGEEILKQQVERLAAAVNISTVSYEDNGDVDDDPRWRSFGDMHELLESLFPLVHSRLKLEKIHKYGLLYHFPGKDKHKKPMLFMAHQDVVPAGNPSAWKHPPFEAHFDGEWVWGRGSADCKSNLIGLLSAMEGLLEQDFEPERSIIFSFGFDEETGGYRGAANLARHLEEKLGPDSVAMIHDEGGMGVRALGHVAYALPAIAEKGFVDIILTLDTPGGHSSRPPKHTAIGIMSKIILALDDHPFRPALDDTSPVRGVLECEAKYSSDKVEPWLKHELEAGHDIGKLIAKSRGDKIRWQIQTSQAVDMIRGGDKDNQLPEEVAVTVNYRIRPHENVDEFFRGIASLLADIAHKQGLAVSGFGFNEESTSKGILKLTSKDLLLPSPITPVSKVWDIFASTLRQVFETASSLPDVETVVPAGSIATGNSDTAHYWNLTRNIFRFTPARDGSRLGIHTLDERMEMNAHLEAVRVYYELMRNFQTYDGDTCNAHCASL